MEPVRTQKCDSLYSLKMYYFKSYFSGGEEDEISEDTPHSSSIIMYNVEIGSVKVVFILLNKRLMSRHKTRILSRGNQ